MRSRKQAMNQPDIKPLEMIRLLKNQLKRKDDVIADLKTNNQILTDLIAEKDRKIVDLDLKLKNYEIKLANLENQINPDGFVNLMDEEELPQNEIPTTTPNSVQFHQVYHCELCDKSFETQNRLKSHLIVHDENAPVYYCIVPHCGFKTKYRASLNRHNTRKHINETNYFMRSSNN